MWCLNWCVGLVCAILLGVCSVPPSVGFCSRCQVRTRNGSCRMIWYGFLYSFYMVLYDFITFRKWKILFVIFGRFSIIFDIFDPGIWIFIFKGSILLQGEVLEALFRPFITLSFLTGQEIRTSGQEFERPVISFFRTSGQEFERPAEIPNIGESFLDLLWHFSFLREFLGTVPYRSKRNRSRLGAALRGSEGGQYEGNHTLVGHTVPSLHPPQS